MRSIVFFFELHPHRSKTNVLLGKQPFHGRVVVSVNEWTNSGAEMDAQFAKDRKLATLMGGIWVQLDIRHQYDEEQKGKRSPFWIDILKTKTPKSTPFQNP